MKKFFVGLILLLVMMLCSCEKKEYNLIQVTGDEIVKCLLSDNPNITFAYYDSNESNSEQLLDDLRKVVRGSKENIYYVDVNHLSSSSNLLLYEYFNKAVVGSYYFAIQDGTAVVREEYDGDYDKLFNNLNGKRYDTKIESLSDNEKDEILKDAKLLFNEGYVSLSLDMLNQIWTSAQARDYFNSNKLYNIVNLWESYVRKDGNVIYNGLLIYPFANQIYLVNRNDKGSEFIKPGPEDYEMYYYKVLDNKVYISQTEDGKYSEKFDIISIDEEHFVLQDGNKRIEYSLMG